jgi:hypothetical protein
VELKKERALVSGIGT